MRMLTRATAATLMLFSLAIPLHAQSGGSVIPDVVYGHKAGMALTFDVFTPPGEPNGVGILNMVSGGWVSRWTPPEVRSRSAYDVLITGESYRRLKQLFELRGPGSWPHS